MVRSIEVCKFKSSMYEAFTNIFLELLNEREKVIVEKLSKTNQVSEEGIKQWKNVELKTGKT